MGTGVVLSRTSRQGGEQTLSYRWAGPASMVAVRVVDYDKPSKLYAVGVRAGTSREVAQFGGPVSIYAVTKDGHFAVLSSGASDLVTVEMSDGAIRRRKTLRSPSPDLRLRESDPVAVSLAD
jgi:hypothetical protein